jgi:hypothetical protein
MEPAVEAFEQLARNRVQLGARQFASFDGLIYPVHSVGVCSSGRFIAEADRVLMPIAVVVKVP